MISIYQKRDIITKDGVEIKEMELRGLSTDEKPTTVPNGAIFIEIDTGTLYMFDEDNEEWKEL